MSNNIVGKKRTESRSRIQVLELRLYQLGLSSQLARVCGDAWKSEALCRGLDTEAFYPETVDEAEFATRVCRRCPVQLECYAHAEEWGVWGGTTQWERADFQRALTHRE